MLRGLMGLAALGAAGLAGMAQAAPDLPGAHTSSGHMPPGHMLPGHMMVGRWANPRGTLAVQTGRCADGGLCGAIVWASAGAQAEARRAGVGALIGTPLLQGYRRTGADTWMGRVYFPDMRRSFSSRLRQTSPATLAISGCLVGGFLCTTQVWHRVA